MYPDNAEDLTVSITPARLPSVSALQETITDVQEDLDLQHKSDIKALNAMTIAALSTFDAFSRQNLVVQVRAGARLAVKGPCPFPLHTLCFFRCAQRSWST